MSFPSHRIVSVACEIKEILYHFLTNRRAIAVLEPLNSDRIRRSNPAVGVRLWVGLFCFIQLSHLTSPSV
jgi:hypothetical protein